jgi:hypothetical protein
LQADAKQAPPFDKWHGKTSILWVKKGAKGIFLKKNNDFLHFFYEKICRVENLLYICIVKQEQWWIHLRARIHASHA